MAKYAFLFPGQGAQVPGMMKDVCEVIDKRLSMAVEAMTRMFEPLVLIIFAIIVFFVVLGFYSAYFGMLGSFL